MSTLGRQSPSVIFICRLLFLLKVLNVDLICRPRCVVLVLVLRPVVNVLVLVLKCDSRVLMLAWRPKCQGLGPDLGTRRLCLGVKLKSFSMVFITRLSYTA